MDKNETRQVVGDEAEEHTMQALEDFFQDYEQGAPVFVMYLQGDYVKGVIGGDLREIAGMLNTILSENPEFVMYLQADADVRVATQESPCIDCDDPHCPLAGTDASKQQIAKQHMGLRNN